MDVIRSAAFAIVMATGLALAAPLEAQATATLNISAVVVEECTIRVKRELVKLARRLKDPSIIRRCSKGVRSRIDESVVDIADLRPPVPAPPRISKHRLSKIFSGGKVDVVLVTVSY